MSNSDVAKDVLGKLDKQMERIEDEELTFRQRFIRRWLTGRAGWSYQFGAWFMAAKIFFLKKVVAYFATLFPATAAACTKAWAAVSSFIAAAFHFGG